MDIAIIKNISREGPGLLESVLQEHSISFEIFDLEKGDAFLSPLEFRAIVVLGGPDSANDSSKKMQEELKHIKQALDKDIPYFGICLGLQILVKAMGGSVTKNPIREIGFRDHENNLFSIEKAADDPLFQDMVFPRPIFHLHGETVDLTNTMKLLASGKWCKNQLVKVKENAYGIQGHMELTDEMLHHWLNEDPDLQTADRERLLSDYRSIKEEYEKTGKQLFTNFLRIAKLI